MAKMINTKYGYVTPQEAEIDAHLDKWMKRRAKHKRRTVPVTAQLKRSKDKQNDMTSNLKMVNGADS